MRRGYCIKDLFVVFSLLLIGLFQVSMIVSTSILSDNPGSFAPAEFENWSAWRVSISKIPTPAAGCFIITFASTVWQPIHCVAPPKGHSLPSKAPQTSTLLQPSAVGNTNDWVAQAPYGTLISSSFGSFPSVSGLTSERDVCVAPFLAQCGGVEGGRGANFYSLQDNANSGFTVDYHGKSTTGWEQFLYANSGDSGVVYIEYWLFNYGTCPSASEDPPGGGIGWFSFGGSASNPASCVFNTNGTPTPFEPATSLSNLSLQTYANFGGNDEVMLCISGGSCYATSVTDTVLHLYQHWTGAEFNVFGYENGAQAQFNSGTTITVRNVLLDSDAESIKTSCMSPPGYTGETNNLNLLSCSTPLPTTDSSTPMTFTETNSPAVYITVASSPLGTLYEPGSGFVTVDGDSVTTPTTFLWIEGSTHSIAAASSVSCGLQCQYVFIGWSDQGPQSHSITVSAPLYPTGLFFPTYTANYQKRYYVTILANGPGYITTASGWFSAGITVTLAATANPQHTFTSWTGTGSGSYTGTNSSTTITVNGPITEAANFS